jgi:hypothetical protein
MRYLISAGTLAFLLFASLGTFIYVSEYQRQQFRMESEKLAAHTNAMSHVLDSQTDALQKSTRLLQADSRLFAILDEWELARSSMGVAHPNEGLAANQKAVADLEGMLSEFPARVGLYLIAALFDRSDRLLRLGRRDEAVKDIDRTLNLAMQRKDYVSVASLLRLATAGDHARATAGVAQIAADPTFSGPTPFHVLAIVQTLAVTAARADKALSAKERTRLEDQYAVGAVALLRRASQEHYFDEPARLEEFKKSPTFVPLHGRQDFQKLLGELAAPPRPTQPPG